MGEEELVTITKAQLRKLVDAAVQGTQLSEEYCSMCDRELDCGVGHTPTCELPALEELCK